MAYSPYMHSIQPGADLVSSLTRYINSYRTRYWNDFNAAATQPGADLLASLTRHVGSYQAEYLTNTKRHLSDDEDPNPPTRTSRCSRHYERKALATAKLKMAEPEAVSEGVDEGTEMSRKRKTESSEVEQRKKRRTESPEARIKREVLENVDMIPEFPLKEGDPNIHHRPSLSNWAKSSNIVGIPGISTEIFSKSNASSPASTSSHSPLPSSKANEVAGSGVTDLTAPGISPKPKLIKEPSEYDPEACSGATVSDPVSDTLPASGDEDVVNLTTSGAGITEQEAKPQLKEPKAGHDEEEEVSLL